MPISNEKAADMVGKFQQMFRGDTRKHEAYERWLVYEEAFPELIARKIADTHEDRDTINRMCKWVDVSCNLALDILGQVAVVWKNGATRRVAKASDNQNQQLRELYDELCIDSLCPEWNAQGYYFNELLVMPQVTGGEVQLHTLLPHMYEPIADEKNPLKDAGYIYTTNCRPVGPQHYRYEPTARSLDPRRVECDYVLLDDVGWRTYDGRTHQLKSFQEHGLDYVPATRLSFQKGFGGHRWASSKRQQRLHDATLAAALVSTTMAYVRKAQNRQLLVAIGNTGGQGRPTNDPETGVQIEANNTAEFSVQTLDFDTPPEHFIRQILWIYQSVARGYGGFVDIDSESDKPSLSVGFPYEVQTEIRDRQLPFARNFEKQLAATIVDMMRAAGHPDAYKLPDSDRIRESFSVDFGKLSRVFADPAKQQAHFEFLKSNGAASQIDLIREQEGSTLSSEQIWKIAEENIKFQARFNDLAARENLPIAAGQGLATAAEVNGAMGPKARDENKAPQPKSADAE